MRVIWKRELQSYFCTAIGFVYMGVFLALASVMFFLQVMRQRSSDLLTFIGQMSYLWMLLSPILTMRLLAEEKQKKTDQLLLTSPVSIPGIICGKYLAAVTVMLLTAVMTLAYVLVVAVYGRVYPGELMVGYAGFLLEGCAFLAVDLMVSGFASNPVTAAVMALGANFVLWMLDLLENQTAIAWLGQLLSFLSIYGRNEPFLMGQLSFASIIFDLSVVLVCLAIAMWRLNGHRYKGV